MPARPVRALRALVAAVLLGASAGPAAAATPTPTQVLQLDGTGFGHGVGMAQVSAQAMALAGQDHEQILQYFYPGTGRDRRSATLAVAVWEADAPTGSVTVALPSGGAVSDGSRSAAVRPGAVLTVAVDADGYHVREQSSPTQQAATRRTAAVPTAAQAAAEESGSPSPSPSSGPIPSGLPTGSPSPSVAPPSGTPSPTASPRPSRSPRPSPSPSARSGFAFDSSQPITLRPSSGVVEVRTTGRSYRGQLRALARQGFRLVNDVDLEVYLRGLGEVPKSWRPAALRTQAVAARTYALRSTGRGRPLGFDICDDTRCQVYLGAGAEGASTTAAAEATRGEVVTFRGSLANTFYSANAGGRTASPGEGFGGTETSPYLPSNKPTAGDVDRWQVRPTPAAVGARLGYPGQLSTMTVIARGPSGRVQRVRLDGSAGAVELTGVAVQRALSLRSNLFTVRLTTGVAEALAPPGTAPGQLSPGDVATETEPPPALVPPIASTATALGQPAGAPGLPVLPIALTAVLLALTATGVLVAGARQGWGLPRRTPRPTVAERSH